MALLRRRIKIRLCRNCGRRLPKSNWLYCTPCKRLLFDEKENIFPTETYIIHIDISGY